MQKFTMTLTMTKTLINTISLFINTHFFHTLRKTKKRFKASGVKLIYKLQAISFVNTRSPQSVQSFLSIWSPCIFSVWGTLGDKQSSREWGESDKHASSFTHQITKKNCSHFVWLRAVRQCGLLCLWLRYCPKNQLGSDRSGKPAERLCLLSLPSLGGRCQPTVTTSS